MIALLLGLQAWADPCGMVFPPPPPELLRKGGKVLQRDGAQRTWVVYDGEIETIALRPGFIGQIDTFGMLIPFPSPPTLRKVDENLFSHVEAAVDPPAMTVDVVYPLSINASRSSSAMGSAGTKSASESVVEQPLGYHEVRVVREEAVGMYEVAVLEAGSPEALGRWMEDNGFIYPEGMDEAVAAYVEAGWCFVAIKARVGSNAGVEPSPGLRSVDPKLPAGSSFDGFVQAMGFRFETPEPVVPMRLSVHNGPAPRNVLYMLTRQPVSILDLPQSLVTRQVPGAELRGHLLDPIPYWFRTGRRADVAPSVLEGFAAEREPERYNGVARELIASDLLAIQTGELSLDFEEEQKELLNLSEFLNLRGVEIDARHAEVVHEARDEALAGALERLEGMTLTVVDGFFDPEVLGRQDLRFGPYTMPADRNTRRMDPIRPAGPIIQVPAFTAGPVRRPAR